MLNISLEKTSQPVDKLDISFQLQVPDRFESVSDGDLASVILDLASRIGIEKSLSSVRLSLQSGLLLLSKSPSGRFCLNTRSALLRHVRIVRSIIERQSNEMPIFLHNLMENILEKNSMKLDLRQREALEMIISSPVSIVHGGPGSGKSTIAASVVRYLEQTEPLKRSVVVAFAAKVAKSTAEKCNIEGLTLHNFAGCLVGEEDFIGKIDRRDIGTLFIDEAFSASPALLSAVLRKADDKCRIVFLGDPYQLAPIGDGRALHDLLKLSFVPSIRLLTSHRLGSGSHLETQSIRVSNGFLPLSGPGLKLIESSRVGHNADRIMTSSAVDLYKKVIKSGRTSIILTPTQFGLAGHIAINRLISGLVPCLGTPLIAIADDPSGRWKNGQKATLIAYPSAGFMQIDLGSSKVTIKSTSNAFLLSHAMSSHRAQGLEFDEVFLVLSETGYLSASRQMLFSAMTRAPFCTIFARRGMLAKIISRDQFLYRSHLIETSLIEEGFLNLLV